MRSTINMDEQILHDISKYIFYVILEKKSFKNCIK